MSILSPALAAGLLLAAIPLLQQHDLPAPTAAAVLTATGATRTTAYKAKAAIEAALPGLLRSAGRPSKPPPTVDTSLRLQLAHEVRDFLFANPGCTSSGQRNTYSARFHLFVLEMCECVSLPYEVVADETGVPLGTLKDWMCGERPRVEPTSLAAVPEPGQSHIQTVLDAWPRWDGGFKAFCAHRHRVSVRTGPPTLVDRSQKRQLPLDLAGNQAYLLVSD